MNEPFAKRNLAIRICLAKILGRVSLTAAIEKSLRRVHEQRRRAQLFFAHIVISTIESGCVNDWLEHRAGLPVCIDRAIELALPVVAPANHRQYLSGLRVQCDK